MLADDVRYLHKDSLEKGVDQIKYDEQMLEIARELFKEYRKTNKNDKDFTRTKKLEKHIAIMRLDYVISGDTQLLTEIEIQELKLPKQNEERQPIHEKEAYLMMETGVNIDSRKMSAAVFYAMLNNVIKINKEKLKQLNNGKKSR